jgi:hypothetical protein
VALWELDASIERRAKAAATSALPVEAAEQPICASAMFDATARWVRKLRALRGDGEGYSDVILRLAAVRHESLSGS